MRRPSFAAWALLLAATAAEAGPVVTFYDDRSEFLSAVSASQVVDFEGVASDDGNVDLGPAFRIGRVTFTALSLEAFPQDLLVVGKLSQTLGAPFDSALLIPRATPFDTITTTFDPASNTTAVGGYFLNLYGSVQLPGRLTLVGDSGLLDVRAVPLGVATSGMAKTFFGFTVSGDVIRSVSLYTNATGAALDDFTHGVASVPEPRSALPAVGSIVAGLILAIRRRSSACRTASSSE